MYGNVAGGWNTTVYPGTCRRCQTASVWLSCELNSLNMFPWCQILFLHFPYLSNSPRNVSYNNLGGELPTNNNFSRFSPDRFVVSIHFQLMRTSVYHLILPCLPVALMYCVVSSEIPISVEIGSIPNVAVLHLLSEVSLKIILSLFISP